MSNSIINLSVAICTWNRASLLRQTLSEFRSLSIPTHLTWELLIVNNNCTDDTIDVVDSFKDTLPIRLLTEKRAGLSNARNLAISESRFDWLLFTDDDVLVSKNWINGYGHAIAGACQNTALLGGEIIPWFPVMPSPALMNAIPMVADGFCKRAVPENLSITLEGNYFPYGANFAIRKSLCSGLVFDPMLGVKGNSRLLGEDVVYMIEILKLGRKGTWVIDAPVRHYVDPARLELPALRRALYDSGRTLGKRGRIFPGRIMLANVPAWVLIDWLRSGFLLSIPGVKRLNESAYFRAFRDFLVYSGYLRETFFERRPKN